MKNFILFMTILLSCSFGQAQTTTKGFNDSRCDKCETKVFFKIFHKRYCERCETVTEPDPQPENYGCYDELSGIDVGYCHGGRNDDYLNPWRFMDTVTGELYCERGVFIVDHSLGTGDQDKFYKTIISEVYDSTGILIDTDSIDVIIGLPGTDKTLELKNIFNFCGPDGNRTICNVNQEIYNVWGDEPQIRDCDGACEFTIEMIDRDTGLNIAWLFRYHKFTYLRMKGLVKR